MQTVLESLEQAYINLINLREEGNLENSCLDTCCREDVYCALSELTKAIVLIIINNDVCPSDKRVYIDITENNTVFSNTDENTKSAFLNALYDNEVLVKEKTVGDLIDELKKFSPSLKVSILGERNKNNREY